MPPQTLPQHLLVPAHTQPSSIFVLANRALSTSGAKVMTLSATIHAERREHGSYKHPCFATGLPEEAQARLLRLTPASHGSPCGHLHLGTTTTARRGISGGTKQPPRRIVLQRKQCTAAGHHAQLSLGGNTCGTSNTTSNTGGAGQSKSTRESRATKGRSSISHRPLRALGPRVAWQPPQHLCLPYIAGHREGNAEIARLTDGRQHSCRPRFRKIPTLFAGQIPLCYA